MMPQSSFARSDNPESGRIITGPGIVPEYFGIHLPFFNGEPWYICYEVPHERRFGLLEPPQSIETLTIATLTQILYFQT